VRRHRARPHLASMALPTILTLDADPYRRPIRPPTATYPTTPTPKDETGEVVIVTMADEKKIDATEEVQKAKAEIAEEVADEEVDASGEEFEVTKEEMSIIRAELACEFPDDYSYLR
jgi:hypothetical protein